MSGRGQDPAASNLACCCRCGTHAWLSVDRLCPGCENVVPLLAESLLSELAGWLEERAARRAAFEAYYEARGQA